MKKGKYNSLKITKKAQSCQMSSDKRQTLSAKKYNDLLEFVEKSNNNKQIIDQNNMSSIMQFYKEQQFIK